MKVQPLTTATEIKEVTGIINELGNRTTHLYDKINSLRDILNPILSEQQPTPENTDKKAIKTNLGEQLDTILTTVENSISNVSDIRKRLEL